MSKEKSIIHSSTDELRWVPYFEIFEKCQRKYVNDETEEEMWLDEYVWGTTKKLTRNMNE